MVVSNNSTNMCGRTVTFESNFFVVCLLFSILLLTTTNAFAQISAGQLQQVDRSLRVTPPKLPKVQLKAAPIKLKALKAKPGKSTYSFKEFVFDGNTEVSTEELQALVANVRNVPLSEADIQLIINTIVQYYRDHGWLAQATIPDQNLDDGIVTIRIIESKLSGIKIDNRSQRVSNTRIESWIYGRLPKGADLSLNALDSAILSLNDLPDIIVGASLEPGENEGETVLVITVVDKPLVNGQVSVDNYGVSGTGKARGSVVANVNGLFGVGDQFSFYGLYSEGNSFGRLGYSMPLGNSGLTIGINGSSMAYRVLNQTFDSLFANGTANNGGAELNYPVLRGRSANMNANANWRYSQYKNWTKYGFTEEQSYDTSVGQFGLTGNLVDGLGGFQGVNLASITGSYGDVGLKSDGFYNRVYGTAGVFAKMRYSFSRIQAITEKFSAYLSVSGQLASKNMDSSEQLYLGGPGSVRAYNSGQGGSSQGNLTTFELRQQLPFQTQIAGFYDMGNVQTWKFNNPLYGSVNNYILQGYGASFGWTGPANLSIRAIWAQRTGQLTQAVASYLSQNGGTSTNRFWITAALPF